MPAPGGSDRDAAAATLTPSRDILDTAKGGGFLLGGTFFQYASGFVIALILTHTLGARDYGLYVLAISAVTLFAAISLLGLDDAMVRYVAIQWSRRDGAGLWGTLQVGFGIALTASTLSAVVLFGTAGAIAKGLFDSPELESTLRVLAVVVPFLALSNLLLGAARGFGRMDHAALAENVLPSILKMVLVLALAAVGRLDLRTALIVYAASDVVASMALIVLTNRTFTLRRPLRAARRDVRAVFGFAFPLWLSGLLRQFRRNIQNVMLGSVNTVTSVGVFEVVNKVNLIANAPSLSVYVSVRPVLARLHDRKDGAALSRVYTTSTRWTFGVNIPLFLLMTLYPQSLLLLFGEEFVSGSTALVIIAFTQLANAATGICQPMLDMTGHTRTKLVNTVLLTVLLIGGGALLIPQWGLVGAAVASLVAVGTVNVLCVVEVRVLEGLLPYDRSFLKPIAAGIGALAVGLILRSVWPVGSELLPAAIHAALVIATYCGLVLFLGLTPDDRLVLDRVLARLRVARTPVGGGAA